MRANLVVAVALALIMASCAGSNETVAPGDSETNISQLRTELQQRDNRIRELESELKQAKDEMKRLKSPEVSPPVKNTKVTGKIDPIQVQTALKNAGYYDGPIDGRLDPQTVDAIKRFQEDKGLGVDGSVGKKTWAALKQHL